VISENIIAMQEMFVVEERLGAIAAA